MTVVNRYLTAKYAPVDGELADIDLQVSGALPTELTGTYLRIGPNPLGSPEPSTYHWFQGDGMVHAITISDGRARYSNRWVRTDRAARRLGEEPLPDQPSDTVPSEIAVANTALVAHAGKLLALHEVSLPVEIRRDGSTIGRYDFDGRLRSAMTAHPKMDPRSGELHFFGYDIFGPPFLRYHVADATGRLVLTTKIDLAGPSMVHDFAVTQDHVVWLDLPVLFDGSLLARGRLPYGWQPGYGARIGIMARTGNAAVTWFEIGPCYVFHILNAYDDGRTVVIDVARYERLFVGDHNGPDDSEPLLTRWTVDLATSRVSTAVIDDRPQEFPRVADRTIGARHRYGYAVAEHGVVQHDFDRGTSVVHQLGPSDHASEALFVPADGGTADDEGWVVTIAHRDVERAAFTQPTQSAQLTENAELLVLDATALDKPPVARIPLPRRVPLGFHALWVADRNAQG